MQVNPEAQQNIEVSFLLTYRGEEFFEKVSKKQLVLSGTEGYIDHEGLYVEGQSSNQD